MKHWVSFLCAVCTRLLARQGLPFVNTFPERQQLSRPHCSVYVCVCDYVHKHMFAVRGRHSWTSERERETEECLLGAAAGVAVMLFLLSALCVCIRACVCVCVQHVQQNELKQRMKTLALLYPPVLIKMKEAQMWMRDYII